jgi:hypothetical protein
MTKNYLLLMGLAFSGLLFGQNSLLLNPTTAAIPSGQITDIELCGNGVDQVLIAACESNKQFYAIDIQDNDWGAAAANTVTTIPDFENLLEGVIGETNTKIVNIEVNRISKAVYVLVHKLAGGDFWIMKVEDDGATVTMMDLANITYSTIDWGTSPYNHQDMTWGDNTLFVSSGTWSLDGEVAQVTAPFEHNTASTNKATSMYKTNWGGAYFTTAPLERIEYAQMNGEKRLMGVTVCAPGFSIETSELSGGGVLQIEELFNVNQMLPEKVVHQNQGGDHYLFDLHTPNTLIRLGEEYIDGSKIGTGEFNNSAQYVRTGSGAITPGLTDEQAKLYTNNFDMISFWDDFNLLVLEADVLKLFPTGTAYATVEDKVEASVSIAPNPATDFFNFKVDMPNEVAELSVFTIGGKLVFKTIVENGQNQIDIKELSKGTYVLKLTANDQQLFTDRLILK